MAKQVVYLCIRTRRGQLLRFGKRDVESATNDAQFYLVHSADRRSEYWFGCDVWLEVAEQSPFRRVDLPEGSDQ